MTKYTFECKNGHSFSLEVDGLLNSLPPSCFVCFTDNFKQTEGPIVQSAFLDGNK